MPSGSAASIASATACRVLRVSPRAKAGTVSSDTRNPVAIRHSLLYPSAHTGRGSMGQRLGRVAAGLLGVAALAGCAINPYVDDVAPKRPDMGANATRMDIAQRYA